MKKYLSDPLQFIYQNDDGVVSERPEIQEILEYALGLEDNIEGDFNIDTVIFEFRYNRFAFIRNGLLIAKAKFFALHKNFGDGTFASFCKEQLHTQRWQVNNGIKAARVCMELIQQGFDVLPNNIAQAMELSKYFQEELHDKWQDILENIAPNEITAKSIRNHIHPPRKEDRSIATIKVPVAIHEEIHATAATRGRSIPELLGLMLAVFRSAVDGDISDISHLLTRNRNSEDYIKYSEKKQQEIENKIMLEHGIKLNY